MDNRFGLPAALLCGLLAACDAPAPAPKPEPPKPVIVQPPVKPPPPVGPTGSLEPWEISRSHVGPLTAATPYAVEAIAVRFPGLVIEDGVSIRGDVGRGVIAVADGKQRRLLEIEGRDWVREVRVLGRQFKTKGGRRVGQTWRQAGFSRDACKVHATWFDESTALKCQDSRDPGLTIMMSIPKVALSRLGKGDVVRYDKAVIWAIDWSQ